jgi:alkylhydroperoxidase/carboxymuconolactone decarboxylase family protein YurZ
VEIERDNETKDSAIRTELPVLGFRNYWYPIMFSKDLKAKPVAERLLGDEIVLFRTNGKAYALANRCPHRGTPLSLGKSRFPGTLSCAYHGWTFDVTGQCVGALLEGPDAVLPRKGRVRSYSVEERAGLIEKVKALFHYSHFERPGASLPEKYRQMLVMAVAAATHQVEGIRIHMRRAFEAGVTQEEVLEALEAIAIPAGFPALWYGALVLEELQGQKEGKARAEIFPWKG